jgi:hypothetical protein
VLIHGAIMPQPRRRQTPPFQPARLMCMLLPGCSLPPRHHRLGKFLADVNELRKMRLDAPHAALEWLAGGGECVYYFTEQLIW